MRKILIGIVGYSPILNSYPLGPVLMENLKGRNWDNLIVDVQNMTWSPIHVTQRLQESRVEFDRAVLIGCKTYSKEPGTIECYKWKIQERIYEGVTGVVSLDNTLVIGDHFKIWPDEVFTVEVDIPAHIFGDIVIAENQGITSKIDLANLLKFDPEIVIENIELNTFLVTTCQYFSNSFIEKSPDTLLEPEIFTKYKFDTNPHFIN